MNYPVFLFLVIAVASIGSALGIILSKRMMYCVIFLGALFTEVFALFLLLGAEYLAAVQLLVYAGAVTVLFIFALMLTKGGEHEF